MSTELAPLQSVQNQIKDKIKGEFASLIPDEMWTQMVASVIAEFTTDVAERDRYSNSVTSRPSPMKQMIRAEIEGLARSKLQAEIDRLGQATWDGFGQQVASEAINKLVAEHFPALLASVQQGMVEMAVTTAVNHMRNSMGRM